MHVYESEYSKMRRSFLIAETAICFD